MKLICASCRRHWTPKKGGKRTESCPGCRHRNLSSAIGRAWDRRKRLAAPAAALPEDGPDAPDTLAELMRAADLASAKALNAALAVTQRGLKGTHD